MKNNAPHDSVTNAAKLNWGFGAVRNDASRCFTLEKGEIGAIEDVIGQLVLRHGSIECLEIQRECAIQGSALPERLRRFLAEIAFNFRHEGFYRVSGFPLDDGAIGDSPRHWDEPWGNRPYFREEIFQCLISAAIGSLFGWRTQENGRRLRHIVPIEAEKDEQLGGSSSTALLWHTEEAFHPARADYLSLMCYRNNEGATTVLANIQDVALDPETTEVLSEARFVIQPDKSHFHENNQSSHWSIDDMKFDAIRRSLSEPRPCAILHGSGRSKTMIVDQAFVSAMPADAEASAALEKFHQALDRGAHLVTMGPGDILIIDNLTTAHGRTAYAPDYGPKQRWMRRVNIRNGRRAFMRFQEDDNPHVMR